MGTISKEILPLFSSILNIVAIAANQVTRYDNPDDQNANTVFTTNKCEYCIYIYKSSQVLYYPPVNFPMKITKCWHIGPTPCKCSHMIPFCWVQHVHVSSYLHATAQLRTLRTANYSAAIESHLQRCKKWIHLDGHWDEWVGNIWECVVIYRFYWFCRWSRAGYLRNAWINVRLLMFCAYPGGSSIPPPTATFFLVVK